MNTKLTTIAAVISLSLSNIAFADSTDNLAQFVNPMIGTDSHGDFSHGNKIPYVASPMPMTLWAPQMNDGSWYYAYSHCSDKERSCSDSSVIDPITGFRQSHLPSPWIGDYGHFSLMPVPVTTEIGIGSAPTDSAIKSAAVGKFKHENETAHPYEYSVTFENGIKTQLTSTRRTGYLRFISNESTSRVVLDLQGGGNYIQWDSKEDQFSGYTSNGTGGLPSSFKAFYNMQFFTDDGLKRIQPSSIEVWDGYSKVTPSEVGDISSASASHLYIVFNFAAKDVSAVVGNSYTSSEQARFNAENELGTQALVNKQAWRPLTFEKAVSRNKALWNKYLSRIKIQSDNVSQSTFNEERAVFYTGLYRTLINPHAWFECSQYSSDGQCNTQGQLQADGSTKYSYIFHRSPYVAYSDDLDGKPKVYNGYMFTDEGTWDVYRTKYPFYSLVYPDVESKLIQGMLNVYKEGGWLSQWSSPGYRDSMTGTHSDCVIADAYLRGVRNYDVDTAFEAILKNATVKPDSATCNNGRECGRTDFDELAQYGYIPGNSSGSEATGNSLDYAYDNNCIANMAEALSQTASTEKAKLNYLSTAQTMREQSRTITNNLFDPDTEMGVTKPDGEKGTLKGFFHTKEASGDWYTLRSYQNDLSGLYVWRNGYNEGSAWQFMFYMQYDVPALAQMFANANDMSSTPKLALEQQLDKMFTSTSQYDASAYGYIHEAEEMTYIGLGQFGFNDQPSWGYVYEYNYTDAPWKTQCIVRDMMDPNRALTYKNYQCFGDVPAGTDPDKNVSALFANRQDGLSGDEDNGSMSAWYINSAMGFHPLPGSDRLEFGSPLFSKMEITIPAYGSQKAKSLTISAPNNSDNNIYVTSISLNGKTLTDLASNHYGINQSELFNGTDNATLVFTMASEPKVN
ncbi:glycoside hydrolase family 92 protein [Vibrio sp. S4M6]|uniref:GH92 family glycosyl hydrolase n=1 Tax=Vibrio sinus TaxID=2946865 RepID=UPI00202A3E42|nr:GH92 family glycosyl hydrolase [Vibrio sinus]MCL9780694.1 glycoside hydrolase family 92 protein [Vibrio sinus]